MPIITGNIYRMQCAIGRVPQPALVIEASSVDAADQICMQHYADVAAAEGKEVRVISSDTVLEQEQSNAPA
jgi:hypothetical protein